MKEGTIGQTSGNGQETRSEATSNCQLSIVHCQLEEPFAAIDFETANGKRSSICSVGIVLVECGQIVDSIYQLIRPYPDYYTHWTTEVHGLTKRDTADAPDFGTAWPFIARRIEGLPLVAHNSVFDEGCLKAAHEAFDLAYPAYRFHCTCRLSRRLYPDLPNHRLETVAEHCGCDLYMHHHALADAEACALIAVRMMREKGVQSLAELWVNAQKKQE